MFIFSSSIRNIATSFLGNVDISTMIWQDFLVFYARPCTDWKIQECIVCLLGAYAKHEPILQIVV